MSQKLNSSNTGGRKTIKFLYSYGGKIVLRPIDGKLRYIGGHTRILSVDRSVSYAELMLKLSEACGSSMTLKCKLPTEDLDVLVTIKSDEELGSLIEEYEMSSPEAKIRAVLFPIRSEKKVSTPPLSCSDFPTVKKTPVSAPPAATVPIRSEKKKVNTPSSPMSCFDFPTTTKARVTAPSAAAVQIRSEKKVNMPSSPMSCFDFPSIAKPRVVPPPSAAGRRVAPPYPTVKPCLHPVIGYPVVAGESRCGQVRNPRSFYNVPYRNLPHY